MTMRHATVGYMCFSVCIYTSIKRLRDSLRTGHGTDQGRVVGRASEAATIQCPLTVAL